MCTHECICVPRSGLCGRSQRPETGWAGGLGKVGKKGAVAAWLCRESCGSGLQTWVRVMGLGVPTERSSGKDLEMLGKEPRAGHHA